MNDFWKWFESNNEAYLFINDIKNREERERLLGELERNLHTYCDQLYFEIGGHPDSEEQELIITAEGSIGYFDKVKELVYSAPKIKNWKFIAFKPPMGIDFITEYEGLKLNPREVWFLPLENPNALNLIGIQVGLKNYNLIEKNTILNSAVYKMLDTVIGEESFAKDIQHVKIVQLSSDPDEHGYLKIKELPEYIEWKKSNYED